MNEKEILRMEQSRRRKASSVIQNAELSARVCERLLALPAYKAARVVMCYASVPGEVETIRLIDRMLRDGKRVCLPKLRGEGAMDAVEITGEQDLQPGAFHIPEPVGTEAVPAEDIDLFLVPGVAFDRAGVRLGRGAGYFDRYLRGVRGLTVGLAYCAQIIERVPAETHDAKMDLIVTENEVIDARGEERP